MHICRSDDQKMISLPNNFVTIGINSHSWICVTIGVTLKLDIHVDCCWLSFFAQFFFSAIITPFNETYFEKFLNPSYGKKYQLCIIIE